MLIVVIMINHFTNGLLPIYVPVKTREIGLFDAPGTQATGLIN
jgi:hypothetical protein